MNNINILNDGCSFSSKDESGKFDTYCNYLPGIVHNIAKPGRGIFVQRAHQWLTRNDKNKTNLTHFILQIPSPTRQLIWSHLEEQDFFTAPIWGKKTLRMNLKLPPGSDPIDLTHLKRTSGRRGGLTHTPIQRLQTIKCILEQNQNINIFEEQKKYLKKALLEIDKIVNLIKDNDNRTKIIFLRYEESIRPLIYEFSKKWFKYDVKDYCEQNNITYIYEDDFNTKWFFKNKLTQDKRHTNTNGAKYIANKIIEYL
tara:strand:+ start:52 stop:816 length:765 start_codon:yes stop_codon:yes gene_type:complete